MQGSKQGLHGLWRGGVAVTRLLKRMNARTASRKYGVFALSSIVLSIFHIESKLSGDAQVTSTAGFGSSLDLIESREGALFHGFRLALGHVQVTTTQVEGAFDNHKVVFYVQVDKLTTKVAVGVAQVQFIESPGGRVVVHLATTGFQFDQVVTRVVRFGRLVRHRSRPFMGVPLRGRQGLCNNSSCQQ